MSSLPHPPSPARRRFLAATAALGAAPLFIDLERAHAASGYPDRPIRYVSPYPPGGTNDLVARVISKPLADALGANVVVENIGGAGGTMGTGNVVRAAPDGYTILNASSGNLSSAPQIIGANYDPLADLVPVGFLGHIRFVFATHPSLPVQSLAEFIAYAKANPGKVNYGTAGTGTGGHIAGEYLRLRTGIDIVHVPYRGSAPALTDAIAGRVQLVLDPLAAQYVRSGALRGLAYSGATRAPDLPGVPTIDAAGVPDWKATNFYLAAVPAHTPPTVIEKLARTFLGLARNPEIQGKLQALGVEILPLDGAATTQLLRAEIAVNNEVIEAAKIPTARTA